MKNRNLLSKMTIEEKINLCCGVDFWHSAGYEKYALPALTVADGPHGVRFQSGESDMLGVNESLPSTCFPTAVCTGSSWDRRLLHDVGKAIGEEALEFGVDTVLGPGLNIKRNPLCGRNFEYISEDPFLAGALGAEYVKGVQENGVGACPKHFAANSQEYKRFSSDDQIDERTLREIYLPAFEAAVKEGNPKMLMCAYNKINGVYCSDNKWLLTDVLRSEWGFDGLVVTDWGAMHDRIAAFKAGCDWSMPGGSFHLQKHALEAYKRGELTQEEIDLCADRMISLMLESERVRKNKTSFNRESHHTLAKKAAVQGAVLLKNDGLLPLKTDKVALIGHMAKVPRYQGSGSSHINPTKLVSLLDVASGWDYAPGCDERGDTTDELIGEAVKAAKAADSAVIVAGLPDLYESEGFDRDNMRMPEGHIRLIEAVAQANPNTVVVLICGAPVETPWLDKVKAVLYMGLPGQAGGEAAFDLLTGRENPSGRLAESWPLSYEDVPSSEYYGNPHKHAQYREGIYVGYRYYETADVPVRFPFGFGLSYTSFEYSELLVDGMRVSARVTNTGNIPGAEVVQLYIAPPGSGPHRPAKELKGFEKLYLQPGESARVSFLLTQRSFALWDDGWKTQKGRYEIQLAASVGDVRLKSYIDIDGAYILASEWQEKSWYAALTGYPPKADFEAMLGRSVAEDAPLKKGSFTNENTIMEMAEFSWIMRMMKFIMERVIGKMNGGKVDYNNPSFKMSAYSSIDSSLFNIAIASGGSMPENIAMGLLEMANGHFIRGIVRMIKG